MATVPGIAVRLRTAVEALPPKLRDHIRRVETEAMALSRLYGQDPERASIAALGHDLVRHKKDEEMLADRKSTRLNSSHIQKSRMPSSA